MAALDGAFPGAVPAAEFLPAPLAGAAPDGVYLLGGRDPGAAEGLGATAGLTPRKRDPRAPLDHCRQKHKMEEEADSCPASKKRRTAVLGPPARDWTSLRVAQPMGRGIAQQQQQGISCATGALEIPCEEMEQVMGEQQCEEAARRKFQEIEDRIIDEDEDNEDELVQGSASSSLPTLVLSDTLKTGLKRDYEGILTKKIVESMSRPSMELVLWKPLPEFLTEKSRPAPSKNDKPVAEGCRRAKPAALHAAFHPAPEDLAEPQPAEMPSDLCGAEGPPGGAEEEMEL